EDRLGLVEPPELAQHLRLAREELRLTRRDRQRLLEAVEGAREPPVEFVQVREAVETPDELGVDVDGRLELASLPIGRSEEPAVEVVDLGPIGPLPHERVVLEQELAVPTRLEQDVLVLAVRLDEPFLERDRLPERAQRRFGVAVPARQEAGGVALPRMD